jgi:hypothetical protein
VRKSLVTVLLLGLPALAQVTGGRETVQDAIRFERQKDAAAARQARIEAHSGRSSAERSADESSAANKPSRAKKGSAARSNTKNSSEPKK